MGIETRSIRSVQKIAQDLLQGDSDKNRELMELIDRHFFGNQTLGVKGMMDVLRN